MKCEQVHDWLPEYAGGELGPRERAQCDAHLPGCAGCQERLDGLEEALRLLQLAGRERAPAELGRGLHLRLVQEPAPRASGWGRLRGWLEPLWRRGSLVGAAAVGAAGMLLVLGGTGALSGGRGGVAVSREAGLTQGQAEAPAPFQVPTRRVAVVDLSFVTDQVIDGVEFEVTLPQELAFIDADAGKPLQERTLRWSGSLLPGGAPIRLPVSGSQPGRYRIVARARAQGLDLSHDVWLEVVRS